jgi:hypothetical protein
MGFGIEMELKTPSANKVFPKAGLNGFDWTFMQGSTFVLRLNFSAKNPRLRQYPKRQAVKKVLFSKETACRMNLYTLIRCF